MEAMVIIGCFMKELVSNSSSSAVMVDLTKVTVFESSL